MKEFWNRISNIGIGGDLSSIQRSRIRISNQIVVIISIFAIIYFLYDFLFLPRREGQQQILWYYIFHGTIALTFVPVLWLNKNRRFTLALFLFVTVVTVVIVMNSLTLAQPFRTELYLFVMAAFAFVMFNDIRIIVLVFIVQGAAYLWIAQTIVQHNPGIASVNPGLFLRIIIPFSILYFILQLLKQENNRARAEVEIKNNQLSADRDEMVKLNFTKDKIFSIISHDLRSPIASLEGVLGLLQDEHMSVQDFKAATAGLQKQVQQLRSSLDELLTWSKAQLHGINPEPQVIELRTLVYEVVSVTRLSARSKGIIVTAQTPAETKVYCDPNMLKSVITNLLTNAIKFTPVGGAVSISSKQEDDWVKIEVEDTGIGIPAENLQKILNPAVHFSTRGTNNEKGTGLGLTMCKEFVAKDNGLLEILSEDGKGSRFTIKLPVK